MDDDVQVSLPFVITDFSYDPDANTVTLTWSSGPEKIYRVTGSTDLKDWSNVLVSGLSAADGESPDDADLLITATHDLADFLPQDEDRLVLRVEEE